MIPANERFLSRLPVSLDNAGLHNGIWICYVCSDTDTCCSDFHPVPEVFCPGVKGRQRKRVRFIVSRSADEIECVCDTVYQLKDGKQTKQKGGIGEQALKTLVEC